MNRKNRKEKEQNTDVSKQICVHKTQNTLLEFNSFLRMAEPKDFWHFHEDFASDYSRIRAVMVDYSKEDSISVYANLSPEIIKYLYSRIWNNVQEFKFFQQKIFCEDKNSNTGRVTVFSIQRKVRNNKGEVLNYPWVVRIQNGTGVAMHNANGGQYCKKDSYRKEKEVTIQLKDEEIFTLFAGYVLELKKNRYFAGWYKGRIVCRSLEYARYFPSAEAAEEYVHKYLGFAGMTCYICHVNWTLASCESENMEDNLLEENGKILSFANYADVKQYQKQRGMEHSTMAITYASRKKKIILAA